MVVNNVVSQNKVQYKQQNETKLYVNDLYKKY